MDLNNTIPDFASPEEVLSDFFFKLEQTPLGEHFAWLDSQIRFHDLGYIFVGACLERIRLHRLFESDYGDFKQYCKEALGKSHAYCLRLIQASQAAYLLIRQGFDRLPSCESQIRPIAQLLPKDKFGNIKTLDTNPEAPSPEYLWGQVLRNADEKNSGTITADLVKKTVDSELNLETKQQQERKRKVSIGNSFNQRLSRIALEEGKTREQVLEELIDRKYMEMALVEEYPDPEDDIPSDPEDDIPSDPEDDIPSDPEDWENDLNLLVAFRDRLRDERDAAIGDKKLLQALDYV